ncbi:response regulator transcription factor [Asaia prunellae]|uniref:response regulator transcription factor n=1 Tax=Asaia prunellae TaxID=610245 RepID=UPI0004725287|nr:response regulator [Asaia prunellae]
MTPLPKIQGQYPCVDIIDDDESIRQALEDLLMSVGHKVRCFPDAESYLRATAPYGPCCLILDIRMPGLSGMDFHRRLREQNMLTPVIFITGHGDIAMGVEAMKNGAIEFLTKPFRELDLLDAINRGLAKDEVRLKVRQENASLLRRWEGLTDGEKAVALRVVEGFLNKQTAAELDLSEITVKVRRANLMRKMEAATLPDLVRQLDRLRACPEFDKTGRG